MSPNIMDCDISFSNAQPKFNLEETLDKNREILYKIPGLYAFKIPQIKKDKS